MINRETFENILTFLVSYIARCFIISFAIIQELCILIYLLNSIFASNLYMVKNSTKLIPITQLTFRVQKETFKLFYLILMTMLFYLEHSIISHLSMS